MSDNSSEIRRLQPLVDRLLSNDANAASQLLSAANPYISEIVRKMLRRFPRVQRWEESDDILQNVNIRLMRTLRDSPPPTIRDFMKLATLQTRRELLDMVKHYYGPQGLGQLHDTHNPHSSAPQVPEPATTSSSFDPQHLAIWTEFHEEVDRLPEEEREVFHLYWYAGLSQEVIAQMMNISVRTVKRRWQAARLRLYDALGGRLPEDGGHLDE